MYNPSLYNIHAAPVNGLVDVDGIEGAKAYSLPPNSTSPPLFDRNKDNQVFWVKSTDSLGHYTLTQHSYQDEPLSETPAGELYVTKDYFDSQIAELKEALNGKRIVPTSEPEE